MTLFLSQLCLNLFSEKNKNKANKKDYSYWKLNPKNVYDLS